MRVHVAESDGRLVRLATGFAGGIGGAGEICGALAAGVMVIGYRKGREVPGGPKDAYPEVKALTQAFKEEFGSVTCADLNFMDFKSPEHLARSGRFGDFVDRYLGGES